MSTKNRQILEHLLRAQEHYSAAMRLLLEDEEATTTVPPPVDTLSHNLAIPPPADPFRNRPSVKPTRMMVPFTQDVARIQILKDWTEADTIEKRMKVRNTAEKLLREGLLTDTDLEIFRTDPPSET